MTDVAHEDVPISIVITVRMPVGHDRRRAAENVASAVRQVIGADQIVLGGTSFLDTESGTVTDVRPAEECR